MLGVVDLCQVNDGSAISCLVWVTVRTGTCASMYFRPAKQGQPVNTCALILTLACTDLHLALIVGREESL